MSGSGKKLPRIPAEHIPDILREAARKIEAGIPLDSGEPEPGTRHIEADIVATALRAIAGGRSPTKALAGDGPMPKPRWETLREIADARAKHGSYAAAYRALAIKSSRDVPAVEKEHKRARRAEREHYRRIYMAGHWPSWTFWRMTDADIDADIAADGFMACDPESAREWYCRRRAAERAEFTRFTGWKEPPDRDKS